MEQKEGKTCQERLDHFFALSFNKWGLVVAGNPCKVFWLSIMLLIGLSVGMRNQSSFEN